ncbi:ABC transporter permease [Gymnodinialimonas ceratoperidinii]|uniref:ABC transporter permease n=1 Tax=Gymnodinialimonas ceratoperidinii TaxID=2856823 RepID=A0A8F6TZP0_9RHOB|nr:ABC transporter permease [Gymnodinialimonas ceratoperidinii]QXT41413.1 ABC transporter permease [Gymnodinialimonas ceratoperidinii]
MRRAAGAVLPILVVVGVIIAIWYAAAWNMNRHWTLDQAERRGVEITATELFTDTMWQERPRLPAPHQVAIELWNTTAGEAMFRERRGELRPNPRSLFFHAFQTLAPTMLGFVIGTLAGMALAIAIVHNRAMDMSVMPWAIASQTIPILAIAPIVIVVLNAVGLVGLVPKSLISAYLSFFPVVVGMVKGLRSPGAMDLDLLRTYSASRAQTFWKLRLPASVPFLFASLKVGIAAALVGTIVAELPTGARFGLGARLLTGSYYGQTIQIWSALFMAAICAAILVSLLGLAERSTLKRMGLDR